MTEKDMSKLPERTKRIVELDDALSKITDGMTIAIGGFINSSHPMLVVRGIIKRGIKNLTVVGAASSGLEIDLLIAAGCARLSSRRTRRRGGAHRPAFRTAWSAARSRCSVDEAMLGLRPRPSANPGVRGTSFPEINPAIKVFGIDRDLSPSPR
jgi:glutaconate CoA-transferase subunit A